MYVNHESQFENIAFLLKFIDWRTRNNIDNVLKEEFPEYDAEYRVIWEGCDKGGNPGKEIRITDIRRNLYIYLNTW